MDKKQFEVHLCSEMYEKKTILIFDLWLMVSVVVADYFCVFYLYLTLLLSNCFYLLLEFTWFYGLIFKISKARQAYGASKNVSSKPARDG